MDQNSFELTPEQKGIVASLVQETGMPALTLLAAIARALEELQTHTGRNRTHGNANGHEAVAPEPTLAQEARTPIWEKLIETSLEIPDDELDLLPTDGATQHDHYIYGTPKYPL